MLDGAEPILILTFMYIDKSCRNGQVGNGSEDNNGDSLTTQVIGGG